MQETEALLRPAERDVSWYLCSALSADGGPLPGTTWRLPPQLHLSPLRGDYSRGLLGREVESNRLVLCGETDGFKGLGLMDKDGRTGLGFLGWHDLQVMFLSDLKVAAPCDFHGILRALDPKLLVRPDFRVPELDVISYSTIPKRSSSAAGNTFLFFKWSPCTL